jgi:hypothetical protein
MNEFMRKRMEFINAGRPLPEKKYSTINKVSPKRAAKIAAEKVERGEDDTELVKWYKNRIKQLTGRCAECGNATETKVFKYAIASVCHLLAKRDTVCPSVKIHPLNWIELCPYHHDQLDKANWEEIETWGCYETIRDRLIMVYEDLAVEERRFFPEAVLKYMNKHEAF